MSPVESTARPKRRLRQLMRWAVAFLVVALCAGIAKFVFDWPAFTQPVPYLISNNDIDPEHQTESVYVYEFWLNFIDSQYLWKMKTSPERAEGIVKGFGGVK